MGDLVHSGSKYCDQVRRQAVLEYAIYGSFTRVAKSMDIPRQTLSAWGRTDWWKPLLSEVEHEKNTEIAAGLGRIVEKAISETEDRLENGDVYVAQGKVTRAPVKAKDAVLIGAVAIDKRQLLLNKPTSISGSSGSKKIEGLIKYFQDISQRHQEQLTASVVSEQ